MIYRGYKIIWQGGPIDSGHWAIYSLSEWLGTADDGELDQAIDEIEEDD